MSKDNPGSRSEAGLYAKVKAGFTLRGTSFTSWCRDQGIGHANARSAILGTWSGPKAKALVDRVVAASGADRL